MAAFRCMKKFRLAITLPVFALLLVLSLLSSPASSSGSALVLDAQLTSDQPGQLTPCLVVKLRTGAEPPDLSPYGYELSSKESRPESGLYTYKPRLGQRNQAQRQANTAELEQARAALEADFDVDWIEQPVERAPAKVPNDPLFAQQGYLQKIKGPVAWDVSTGDPKVIVAVLDTGVDQTVAEFAGKIVYPYSVLDDSVDWPYWADTSANGHGTAVAALAVARGNDAYGMAGTAWDVALMPVKISSGGSTNSHALALGIYWAVDHGAKVINISFSGSQSSAEEEVAINYALSRGVTVVAAAGNEGAGQLGYPAAFGGVISVGAITSSDQRASYSNYGMGLSLVAPGDQIICYGRLSAQDSWRWAVISGTSFSAPQVAGTVALMLSANSTLSPTDIRSILSATADDLGPAGVDTEYGAGRLDAGEAVSRAFSLLQTGPISPGSQFIDIGSSPYAQQIAFLASLGIVSGYGDGHFYPEQYMKRQQFAKTIVLTLGLSVSETDTCPFVDVEHNANSLYPYHYVAVAWKAGITKGTSASTFSPYVALSRAQLITMVARAAQLPEPPSDYTPPFGNFSATHFPYARRAAYAGLLDGIVGMGSAYNFWGPATRGEVCAILYNLVNYLKSGQ